MFSQFMSYFACKTICLMGVLTFVAFTEPPIYAQMGYGTNYSDTWIVGVNQPSFDADDNMTLSTNGAPSTYVEGYGSVEDGYNSYGHTYSVDVYLDSPDGRTVESYGEGETYARADVSLPLLGISGIFATSHSSIVSCPISNTSFSSGGGGSSRRIGISFSAFYKAALISPYRAVYQVVSPCDVTCVFHPSGAFYRLGPPPQPNYVRVGEPFFQLFGYRICENVIDSYEESSSPLTCFETSL